VLNLDNNKMWQLELGGEVIATFCETFYEFPWHDAEIVNSPKFEHFREFFSDEEPGDSYLYDEILVKGDFVFRYVSENIIYDNVLLHEDGNTVSFRCCEIKPD
jgi:hypothetical protein